MMMILISIGVLVLLSGAHCERSYQDQYTVDHTYYTMNVFQDNVSGMYDKHLMNMSDAAVHEFLSSQTQAAEKIEPGFIFPFYGHLVHNFYVTTHGFLSFAPRIHNLMYKTQYIAPLRVKLDPARFNESTVMYKVHGPFDDSITIQWTNVTVAEPFEHPLGGKFTFQVTIHANGDIVFVYIFIPDLLTTDALYDNEPVAGLSDAFLIGDSELHVYHTLNVDNTDIKTGTVIVFTAKPTCIRQTSCDSCVQLSKTSEFQCSWCPEVHRCSDGADRLREHWDQNNCGVTNITTPDQCLNSKGSDNLEWRNSMVESASTKKPDDSYVTTVVSAVISAVLVLVLLLVGGAFLYIYGRRNPGGLAERLAARLEAPYKRFGMGDEANNNEHVELGQPSGFYQEQKRGENNNTVTF